MLFHNDPVSGAGPGYDLAPRPLLPLLILKRSDPAEKGMVISIIDDDESLRKALQRLIKSVGLMVEAFASAEDFLSSASSGHAACLVLDVQLPGMNGLELQSQLHVSSPDVPIVFISAHGNERERAQALEAGAIDFLQKPFNEKALFHAINSALSIENRDASGIE